MPDDTYLDQKYFIDTSIWNCPFCNRRHVSYSVQSHRTFDWSTEKKCYIWLVKCDSCESTSMHLTYEYLQRKNYGSTCFAHNVDLDAAFFFSVPTSFFTIDMRVPKVIRELITEAEGCIKMNYLTGASACCRKAIYELTVFEKAEGDDYESRIKYLKEKFPVVDGELFDVLCHIKDMTSDKVHEQSWDKWDSKHLTLFVETLKAILHELYVVPDEKKNRSSKVQDLLRTVKGNRKNKANKKLDPTVKTPVESDNEQGTAGHE